MGRRRLPDRPRNGATRSRTDATGGSSIDPASAYNRPWPHRCPRAAYCWLLHRGARWGQRFSIGIFRINQELFQHIMSALEGRYKYFRMRWDASGKEVHGCCLTVGLWRTEWHVRRVPSYRRHDCPRMSEIFVSGGHPSIRAHISSKANPSRLQGLMNLQRRVHDFLGILGSIDCMNWEWKNCPTAWKGCTRLVQK